MNIFDYILLFISSVVLAYFVQLAVGKLFQMKLKITPKLLILLIINGIIIEYGSYNMNIYENIVSCLVSLSATSIILYKENLSKTIFSVMFYYIIATIYEILISIIIVKIMKIDLISFNSNSILKSLYSIFDILLAYFTCSNKYILSLFRKVSNKNMILNLILIIVSLALVILDGKYLYTTSNRIYISNILILFCILFLMFISIINQERYIKENEKTEILLKFMTKYEKTIDDNRVFKHELLNNLLTLKSFKNKNTKEFNELLDELIDSNNKNNVSIKNIYNLPSGMKGIFYYKLYNLQKNGFDININISKKIGNISNSLSHKTYINLYRIIGIVLDNAIEAAEKSSEKTIIIDIYELNENIIIEILNSYNENINIKNIKKKNYSTKGNNRGLGLYLLSQIINNDKNIKISLNTENNIFKTEIIINKNKN